MAFSALDGGPICRIKPTSASASHMYLVQIAEWIEQLESLRDLTISIQIPYASQFLLMALFHSKSFEWLLPLLNLKGTRISCITKVHPYCERSYVAASKSSHRAMEAFLKRNGRKAQLSNL
jgi:hypothetical protein